MPLLYQTPSCVHHCIDSKTGTEDMKLCINSIWLIGLEIRYRGAVFDIALSKKRGRLPGQMALGPSLPISGDDTSDRYGIAIRLTQN